MISLEVAVKLLAGTRGCISKLIRMVVSLRLHPFSHQGGLSIGLLRTAAGFPQSKGLKREEHKGWKSLNL